MILAFEIAGYVALLALLTFGGNTACKWVLRLSATTTVARYRELDEQHKAEYFLIGSLTSILWAVVITAVIAIYDRAWGFGVLHTLGDLFGRKS